MKLQRIAVLTSGGDSPGMNAAVRAVVRVATYYGIEVIGARRGYEGLISADLVTLKPRAVSNIIQRGGTILKTSRSKAFRTRRGLMRASVNLDAQGIGGLVAIGGNGTYRGAYDLGEIWTGNIVGVPGTIDNDIYGTDWTIGYDTAVNTALEAIDKIRDTADAHGRFFLVEVMGRQAGFIALDVGIGGGAEEVLVPETVTNLGAVARRLRAGRQKGKTSSILIVSEGDDAGGAFSVAKKLKKLSGADYRVVVLGHLQRGGSPTAQDRRIATELGAFAVQTLRKGKTGVAVGTVGGKLKTVSLKDAFTKKKKLDPFLLKLVPILAT